MTSSRRDFIKLLGVSAGSVLLLDAVSSHKAEASSFTTLTQSKGKAMLYDALKCVGCRACQNACKEWNKTPSESIGYGDIYDNPISLSARHWTIIKAREYTHLGSPALLLCRYQCMHCTEASCEAVCPTRSISHQGAAVVINQEWCIGCGYCVQACPFGVPHREHGVEGGTAQKCTFCVDRQADGLAPACVEACPAGALQFGQRDELITQAKNRVSDLKKNGYPNATLYGENELGGLHALYILAERPSIYGLPETPSMATSKTGFQWFSGFVAAGILIASLFWFLFRRRNKTKELVTPINDTSGEE
jgi:formate dehydrogenase iron-sulfur subunit